MATQTKEQKAAAKAKEAAVAVEAEAARRALLTDEERATEDAQMPGAEATPTDGKNSVTVTYPGGSRVYSKEVHGADYKANAKEFAEKRGGTVA